MNGNVPAQGEGECVTILEPASRKQCAHWTALFDDAKITYRVVSEPCRKRSYIRAKGGRWYTLEVEAPSELVIFVLKHHIIREV